MLLKEECHILANISSEDFRFAFGLEGPGFDSVGFYFGSAKNISLKHFTQINQDYSECGGFGRFLRNISTV